MDHFFLAHILNTQYPLTKAKRELEDTLYLHYGKQYLKDCFIEGSVDFIFGNSTALLEHCHIHCKSQGFITAQSRKSSQESTGYVFLRSSAPGLSWEASRNYPTAELMAGEAGPGAGAKEVVLYTRLLVLAPSKPWLHFASFLRGFCGDLHLSSSSGGNDTTGSVGGVSWDLDLATKVLILRNNVDATYIMSLDFFRCVITGNGNSAYSYLGRPWGPFARVVFAYTWLDPCIRPAGWHNWDKIENERNACFFQYRCSGPGSILTSRVPWSRELDHEEAEQFLMHSFIDPERPWLAQRMGLRVPYSA
ncbi:hypothetical protein Taro_023239 [Colocasia esculenta]|uniref:Pectinesterase n=1 Tax=Colocasia esculenta TaxID=4460 RepID=A0A843V5V2_COLES|nr:hypothetical protein [Colocasia esculenta]